MDRNPFIIAVYCFVVEHYCSIRDVSLIWEI